MTEPTERLIKQGILPKDYEEEELIRDLTEEYFGGLFEIVISDDDIEMYFPKCCWNQVAYIHTSSAYEGFSRKTLKKLFTAFELPGLEKCGGDVRSSFSNSSAFTPIENLKMNATHFIGKSGGMLWSVFLDSKGHVVRLDGHDVTLIEQNDEDDDYFKGANVIEALYNELRNAEFYL